MFELVNRESIMKYSLINMRRLIGKKCIYEERVTFVIAMASYLFAFYAVYGRLQNGIINIVVGNFLHEFNDSDMKDFIRSLVELRNDVAHATYVPSVIRKLNDIWEDVQLNKLLVMIESDGLPYTKDNPRLRTNEIDPFNTMAGK